MANVSDVTEADFQSEVLQAGTPVLVDFWATWCAPCKAIAPILDELAGVYGDKLRIVKVNGDENPRIMTQYNVRSLPTVLLFKGGQIVGQQIGAAPKSKFEALVKPHL